MDGKASPYAAPGTAEGGSMMEHVCFNFECPAHGDSYTCPCVVCPNRVTQEFTVTHNRILTEQEISAILAKMQNKEEA